MCNTSIACLKTADDGKSGSVPEPVFSLDDMDEILKKIEQQQAKIDAMYVSVEKLRRYFMWTLIITVVTIVIPLIILVVALPFMVSTITSTYGGLL
jgi:hypothetical protein